jgi:hypothetical protein
MVQGFVEFGNRWRVKHGKLNLFIVFVVVEVISRRLSHDVEIRAVG